MKPTSKSPRILDDEDATLETFAYDPAGNRTTGGGVTTAYTRDNRLAATTAQGVTRSWRYGSGLDWLTETSAVGGETLERLQLEDGLYKRARLGNLYKEYLDLDLDLGHGVRLVREYGMDGNTLTYESVRPVVHLADLLGSTVATFDVQGNTIADRYYTAFGDERQASGAPTPAPATALARFDDDILRGYTGHHSLSESRLVHMGGRGYDAKLGRFLSADPAWQMPYASQSWNRYSYALNSPYRFTDPTGYEIFYMTNEVFPVSVPDSTSNSWKNPNHSFLYLEPNVLSDFAIGAKYGAYASMFDVYLIGGSYRIGVVLRAGPQDDSVREGFIAQNIIASAMADPPTAETGLLQAQTNYRDDPANTTSISRVIPAGHSDSDAIALLLQRHLNYQSNQDARLVPFYGLPWIGGDKPMNSNSYIRGLLDVPGLMIVPGPSVNVPLFSEPVPNTYFEQNWTDFR